MYVGKKMLCLIIPNNLNQLMCAVNIRYLRKGRMKDRSDGKTRKKT